MGEAVDTRHHADGLLCIDLIELPARPTTRPVDRQNFLWSAQNQRISGGGQVRQGTGRMRQRRYLLVQSSAPPFPLSFPHTPDEPPRPRRHRGWQPRDGTGPLRASSLGQGCGPGVASHRPGDEQGSRRGRLAALAALGGRHRTARPASRRLISRHRHRKLRQGPRRRRTATTAAAACAAPAPGRRVLGGARPLRRFSTGQAG